MTISVTLHEVEAVHAVSALESQIDKIAEFCRDRRDFGAMNNIHKQAMHDLISARDTLITQLRAAGYLMTRVETYDTTLPEWRLL